MTEWNNICLFIASQFALASTKGPPLLSVFFYESPCLLTRKRIEGVKTAQSPLAKRGREREGRGGEEEPFWAAEGEERGLSEKEEEDRVGGLDDQGEGTR